MPSKTFAKKKANKSDWTEFECPECSANNPWDEGFRPGDELFCSWCGAVLEVKRVQDDPDRCRVQAT